MDFIFVPEWGWVGSAKTYPYQTHNSNFRPRLGMGWFAASIVAGTMEPSFSSPSGDGLVRIVAGSMEQSSFSSPLGDGLVRNGCMGQGRLKNFRPRVGMGWFRLLGRLLNRHLFIFVPAWGWVGSTVFLMTSATVFNFRPRLGMGWFALTCDKLRTGNLFSSPLGDGLVPYTCHLLCQTLFIFVPAWGWVGSPEVIER